MKKNDVYGVIDSLIRSCEHCLSRISDMQPFSLCKEIKKDNNIWIINEYIVETFGIRLSIKLSFSNMVGDFANSEGFKVERLS